MLRPSAHIRCGNPDIRELATLYAKGYLRLTQTRRSSAASGADSGREKPLDVPRRESPHVVKVKQR